MFIRIKCKHLGLTQKKLALIILVVTILIFSFLRGIETELPEDLQQGYS